MKKLIQSRLHIDNTPTGRGNCYPTALNCFMELDNIVEFQEYYTHSDIKWMEVMMNWISENGWELYSVKGHDDFTKDEYYLVSGISPRNKNITHIVIYKNRKLWHDPHPDNTGILTEDLFYAMNKL